MWDQGSEGWDLGSHLRDQGPQAIGSGSAVCFFRNQGSGCNIFMGSAGTKICHAFGIKDQKYGYKNWVSDEKTHLVTTLKYQTDKNIRARQNSHLKM